LFGNIFAGEVLITVISSLVSFFIPLPFMMLEILVGVIQATVFSMLTLVYLTVLSEKPHGQHEEAHHEKPHGAAMAAAH
jgi:F-type H+-transporting ATPase subunit a